MRKKGKHKNVVYINTSLKIVGQNDSNVFLTCFKTNSKGLIMI